MKSKQKIIVFTVLAVVAVALFFGGRGVIEYTRAAEQAELDAYQAEQQAQLEAARKAELEAAANAPKISLAPVAAVESTVTSEKSMPSATVITEPDGSITITPDFEAQAAAASQLQKPNEKVSANMSGAGGDLPLGKDGAYHGDHPATPAPRATVTPTQETPKATSKPSETSQKPTVSQTPTPPAAASEPPTASQKPSGDDSGSGDKPEVTPKPSQQPQSGPPSYTGKNGEISSDGKYMYCQGFGWVERGGSDGGDSGQLTGGGEGGLSGHKVGNM